MPTYFFGAGVVVAGGLATGALGGVVVAGLGVGAGLLLETCIAS
jgi:hypothetical protein